MTREFAARSAIAFVALLFGAGCGGPPAAPATPADATPAPAGTSAPTGLAAASTDAVWLKRDKKTLEFEGSLDELKARLTKDALAGVTHLVVSGLGLGADLASVIGTSKATSELLALDVSDNDLGPRGAATLALASGLGKLQELD